MKILMFKRTLKGIICLFFLLLLSSCANQGSRFYVISDYDYFMDAGDMGFYKKGDLYGFIRLNGDTSDLELFALDEKLSEGIYWDHIKSRNGLATFSISPPVEGGRGLNGFMDLQGNVVMKEEWDSMRVSAFSSTGYASVTDKKLDKYVIIDKEGKIVRDSQSIIQAYYPDPDLFICRDAVDIDNSFTDYYVLDKDLNLLLNDLQVYYHSGPELAHTRQYTIYGDSEKFIYKKNDKYYIYNIKSNKTIAEYADYDDLLKSQNEFIEKLKYDYIDYEHPSMTESYNGVFIQYDKTDERYRLTDKNGKTLFEPDPDITGLTYLKGKVIQGVSKSTGKVVVIFDRKFK